MRILRTYVVAGLVGITAGVALAIGAYAALDGNDSSKNPCEGLSDSECHALISGMRDDFEEKFKVWIADFNERDVDLKSLETSPLSAAYGPLEVTMDAAVASADVVVIGTSREITFDTQWGYTTFAVEETAKGQAASEITIAQPGGPRPYPDWDGTILAVSELDPLLVPGDKAILFLNYSPELEKYEVQPGTGFYRVDAEGVVSPLDMNPFAGSANRVRSGDFLDQVEAMIAE